MAGAMRYAISILAIVVLILFSNAGPAPYEQQNTTLGQNGGAYFADTSSHLNTNEWAAFTVVAAATFSVYTPNAAVGITNPITSVSFPAGLTVFGLFTNFTLSAGSVIVYNARNPAP